MLPYSITQNLIIVMDASDTAIDAVLQHFVNGIWCLKHGIALLIESCLLCTWPFVISGTLLRVVSSISALTTSLSHMT